MSRPLRNLELEQLVIDVLQTTAEDAPDRQAAWAVYADWLLGNGEPVGEWLAASLRADDQGEAAAPIRARLHEIAAATRFRLVDNELLDLSEVPELSRIAELTWERGFITSAVFRCRSFRRFDSELLGHTPDRLLEVVLRSSSASMLHRLELDASRFETAGSRWSDLAALLAALPEQLPLRELCLGHAELPLCIGVGGLAKLGELRRVDLRGGDVELAEPLVMTKLERLRLRVEAPGRVEPVVARNPWSRLPRPPTLHGPRLDALAPLFDSTLPALTELELELPGVGDGLVDALVDAAWLGGLRRLRIAAVDEAMAAALLRGRERLAMLPCVEIEGRALPAGMVATLREQGWVVG